VVYTEEFLNAPKRFAESGKLRVRKAENIFCGSFPINLSKSQLVPTVVGTLPWHGRGHPCLPAGVLPKAFSQKS
jgi:hypothetical protein